MGPRHNSLVATSLVTMLCTFACTKAGDATKAVATTPGAAQPAPAPAPSPGAQTTTAAAAKVTSVDSATVTAATSQLQLAGAINLIVDSSGSSLALSDYDTDQGQFNTNDQSLSPLNSVQTILCFMSKIGYADSHVVNNGPYIAQMDMTLCDKNSGSSSGSSGSSASKQVKMVAVTVDSKREPNKPLIANAWFDMNTGGGGGSGNDKLQRINANITIAEGPSEANPLGIFRMTFVEGEVNADGTGYAATGHGQVEAKRDSTGAVVLNYLEDNNVPNQYTQSDAAAIRLVVQNDKVVGGFANMSENETDTYNGQTNTNKGAYKVAFDQKYWATSDANSNSTCRDQHAYNMNVWQYGVYNVADKNRIAMKGGFPFAYKDAGGAAHHGYASYWGINGDNNASIPDGTEVTQDMGGSSSVAPATYRVVSGPGKLTKHTRTTIDLAKIDGIELNGQTDTGSPARVVYSNTLQLFQLTGTQSNSSNNGGSSGPQWTDVTPSTTYALAPSQSYRGPNNNFWSQALGGRVVVELDSSYNPTGKVDIFADQDVTATAGALTLNCLQQCVTGNLSAAQLGNVNNGNSPSPFYTPPAPQNAMASPWSPWELATPVVYTYDATNHVLVDKDGRQVVLATGVTVANGENIPQVNALVDNSTLATMVSTGAQAFDAQNQTVSYTWNIANPSQPWTQYEGLIDSTGATVQFDPPLLLKYTHTPANDAAGAATNPDFGKTFYIQFDGQNLMIPGHQDADSGFWVSDFSIKAGVQDDTNTYVFKPLNGEKYMKSVDASNCAALSLSQVPAIPDPAAYDATKENKDAKPDMSTLSTKILNGAYAGT